MRRNPHFWQTRPEVGHPGFVITNLARRFHRSIAACTELSAYDTSGDTLNETKYPLLANPARSGAPWLCYYELSETVSSFYRGVPGVVSLRHFRRCCWVIH